MEMRYQLRHSPVFIYLTRRANPPDRIRERYSIKHLIVELRGFEPLTLSMPWRCATSCAIAPFSFIRSL